jgi:glycosyltransferase involved in cell wall biosynthesis
LSNRLKVGVFRTTYPLPSEVFITEQVKALKRFDSMFLCRDFFGKTENTNVAYLHDKFSKWWWTLTRSPSQFDVPNLKDLSLVHVHFGPDAVMAMPLTRKLNIPMLTTFHGMDITRNKLDLLTSKRPTDMHYALHLNELKRSGTGFIAVSDFVQNLLLKAGFAKDKIRRVYIGVDTTRFCPVPRTTQQRYVLCVGRHTPKKGLVTLLKAWARIEKQYPEVKLLQIGAGPQTAELVQLITDLSIANRVELMGSKSSEEVRSYMQQAEIFALPSQTAPNGDSEALGIVFNEASACGIPIVSTRHGGIPEAVLDGETGLLVAEGDDAALANALAKLLGDADLRAKMGQRGREFVLESFDIAKQTTILEAFYSDAIAEHTKKSASQPT